MRRIMMVFALFGAAALPAGVHAQAMKLSDLAGTWNGRSTIGPKDSVITTSTVTVSPDGKTWTLKFPNRDPLPMRMIAMGGDSVVVEVGPYSSILRPGVMVTTRLTSHYKGNNSTGTFTATYSNGDVVHGKGTATRTK